MRKKLDKIFAFFICGMTVFSILVLGFVIYFIVREALPLFSEVSVLDFLFGSRWMPVDYTGTVSFGIFNFIAATIAVSFTALALALGAGLGAAVFLAFVATERLRSFLYPFVDLLAGIPSVIYGFVGLQVLVKLFLKAGVPIGSCVLAAGILLAVMMVMGNANLFPRLLGKSESIASVIALEMGTAVYGSTHYHALYAAGMVLMLLLFLINGLIGLIRSRMEGETL